MGTSAVFLISLFAFLQLLATLTHAGTLSDSVLVGDSVLNALRENDNLKEKASSNDVPPFAEAHEMKTRESFWMIQMKRARSPPPPPPYTPPGPHKTPRPSPPPHPSECFCCNLLMISSITGTSSTTSHGDINSSSLAYHLCYRFGNTIMDSKQPVGPPPLAPPTPHHQQNTDQQRRPPLVYLLHSDGIMQSYV